MVRTPMGDERDREAERATLETIRRLEAALRAARIGTWYWDLDRDEITWDATMYALCGIAPGDTADERRRLRATIHPDDREGVERAIRAAISSGQPYEGDYRVLWPDGSIHVLFSRGDAESVDGRPRRIAGVSWDVTESRRVEAALRRREALLELLRRFSVRLIDAAPSQIDDVIDAVLARLGEFAGVHRVHVFAVGEDPLLASCVHEWCAPGVPPVRALLGSVPTSALRWGQPAFAEGKAVAVRSIASTPPGDSLARRMVDATGTRSWLALPLQRGERLIGAVDMATVGVERDWSSEDADLLLVVGEMVANALDRKRGVEALHHRLGVESLLASLAAVMSHLADGEMASGVQTSLGVIARFLDCDHAFRSNDGIGLTSHWAAPGAAPLGAAVLGAWSLEVPWVSEQVARNRALRVDEVSALPETASPLRALLEPLGITSLLILSLPRSDGATSLVGCASTRGRRTWRNDDVLFLRMAADVILTEETRRHDAWVSSALARAGRELISVVDQESILRRTCELAAELVPADACMLLLLDPGAGVYDPVAGHGLSVEQWAVLRVARFPFGMVAGSGGTALNEDVAQVRSGVDRGIVVAMQERLGFSAGLHCRLRRGADVIGSIVAVRRGAGASFTAEEARILVGLAQLASFALANAGLVEELEAANRVKSDFLATMSHELRTPLNIIIGYDDLLLEGSFGELGGEQRDILARIGRSSRGLLQMIEATLTIDRLDRGRVTADLRPLAPADLVAELEAETEELRSKAGVSYRSEVRPDLPVLRSDAAKLKMILRNLIENAFKFTLAGTVRLEVAAEDGGVSFTVSDSGPGIEPGAVPVIFEPFRQALDQNEVRPGGVGLGLYIVRRLLELLGGTISVDSAVGRGSTFRIWLPADPTV